MKSRRFGTGLSRVFLKAREASGRIERACRRAVVIRGVDRLKNRGVTNERREEEAYFYMEDDREWGQEWKDLPHGLCPSEDFSHRPFLPLSRNRTCHH